jgi:succinate dehydrogenase / fumarate reductase, cytochrome b subunit
LLLCLSDTIFAKIFTASFEKLLRQPSNYHNMKWSEFLTSSVGKKFVMGLTGLFLISFLVVHVGLYSCIFYDLSFFDSSDNGSMFNRAADFMGSSVVIRIMEIGLFIGFILHIVQGYVLELQNRSKRKMGYEVSMGSRGSRWYRKSMGLLGTLILFFLIMHISHFWVPSRVTHDLATVQFRSGADGHDLFRRMVEVFQNQWIVLLYVLACISLAWHLMHGFQSAFRTMGIHNKKYIVLIQGLGVLFSIIVPLLFALMPISMHLGWVGFGN